jgi:hypothetical protein
MLEFLKDLTDQLNQIENLVKFVLLVFFFHS